MVGNQFQEMYVFIVIKPYGLYIELDELFLAKVWPQSRSNYVLSSDAPYI